MPGSSSTISSLRGLSVTARMLPQMVQGGQSSGVTEPAAAIGRAVQRALARKKAAICALRTRVALL